MNFSRSFDDQDDLTLVFRNEENARKYTLWIMNHLNHWFKKTIRNQHFIVAMKRLRSPHSLCGQHLHWIRLRTNPHCVRGEVESFRHIFMECLRYATHRSHMLSWIFIILRDGPINYDELSPNEVEVMTFCIHSLWTVGYKFGLQFFFRCFA